ncbi:metallophosphoesterase [bacterium]|nr:MAG: metallophosphoesterase [bacterium]
MTPKTSKLTRRTFLTAAAATPGIAALSRFALAAPAAASKPGAENTDFSFVLLGDLHFDRMGHHDMEWLMREKPNDLRQIENYSRITTEMHPRLFAEVKETVAAIRQKGTSVPFVLHAGDLVEGLCGTPALAKTQSEEALAFTQNARLDTPFLFCKGNHDITGPGATEAYNSVFLPFLGEQRRQVTQNSNLTDPQPYFSFEIGQSFFAFFDAYDDASLEWLEGVLATTQARHIFVLIHPPVVPYGARSTWHLYSKPREAAQRERLLNVLGKHNAVVLGGHIHKYNLSARRTPTGRFVQLAVNSVIPRPTEKPSNILEGVGQYTPDQISVEPKFSPDTEAERRAALAAEAPFIDHFEYADAPGYAVISVKGDSVEAQIYSGLGKTLWRTRDLSALLRGPLAQG